jgi:hypothetical protein
MCSYSMVIDWKADEWQRQMQEGVPVLIPSYEIDELKRLLVRAREYDKKMNQPDCEEEEKKRQLIEVAKLLGVELDLG